MDLKLETGVSLLQVYAPQQGRTTVEKEELYRQLKETIDDVKYQENIILRGDWNGHIGCSRTDYEHNIGAHRVGGRNAKGQRVLDVVIINNSAIMNTYYQHRESHKWTRYRYNYQLQSYTQRSMIDLLLTNNKALSLMLKRCHQFQ